MNATTAPAGIKQAFPIKLQHLALGVCGAILVAAGIGLGSQLDSGASAEPARNTVSFVYPAPSWTSALTFYLVDSEAQRDLAIDGEQQAARERVSAGYVDYQTDYAVLMASTPEEEARALEQVGAAMAEGVEGRRVFVQDLRQK